MCCIYLVSGIISLCFFMNQWIWLDKIEFELKLIELKHSYIHSFGWILAIWMLNRWMRLRMRMNGAYAGRDEEHGRMDNLQVNSFLQFFKIVLLNIYLMSVPKLCALFPSNKLNFQLKLFFIPLIFFVYQKKRIIIETGRQQIEELIETKKKEFKKEKHLKSNSVRIPTSPNWKEGRDEK